MAGSTAQRLLSLPTFAFSVFIFYWSLPIFGAVHWVRFLKLSGPRNDVLDWSKSLMRFFGVKVLKQGTLSLYRGSRCMYLCNHRSWADFFVDAYVLEGRAAFLSRWLVFFVFPVFCTSCTILRAILLFKRGPVKDKEMFNQWLDRTFGKSMVPGLMVYPEGHRSLLPHSLPLKRGMLHYAYGRKLPLQIVMTSGKEGVLSEKTMSVHFGRTLVVQYSRVLKPEDYKDFEAFFTDLSSVWDSTWKEVNSASTAGLPRLDLTDAHSFDYPTPVKAKQLAITLASIVILAAVLYGMVKGTAAVLLASGPAQPFIVALLVLWVGASFVTSFL